MATHIFCIRFRFRLKKSYKQNLLPTLFFLSEFYVQSPTRVKSCTEILVIAEQLPRISYLI